MLRFLIFLFMIALVALGLGYKDYQQTISEPLNFTDEQRNFTIERGWSAKRVLSELEQKQIIDKPHWVDVYFRISKSGTAIKSGEFVITGNPNIPELIDIFERGQTKQYELVQTIQGMSDTEIMEALDLAGQHPEGLFFSDTYQFPKNTSDIEFLARANDLLNKVLTEEWEQRAPDLPLKTPYEALILASIVEKETAAAEERPLIAGVFLSRINKRMRLQTDPTVIYGMGDKFDGNIRRRDLTTDTPYNTYTRAGLPPTPIAMVGREAIHAVLNPTSTTALYFVARHDGSGTHKFSDTLEEHNAAVRKYQLKR